MILTVVDPPQAEPVSLAEARKHLRIDADMTDEDGLIQAWISAARQAAEQRTGRAFARQTLRYSRNSWPTERQIALPMAPLISVESVLYTTAAGEVLLLPPEEYTVDTDSEPGRIVLAPGRYWPAVALADDRPIRITYQAGYEAVPKPAWAAMLLILGHLYEHREAVNIGNIVNEIPMSAQWLLDPLVVVFSESR